MPNELEDEKGQILVGQLRDNYSNAGRRGREREANTRHLKNPWRWIQRHNQTNFEETDYRRQKKGTASMKQEEAAT